MRMMMIDDDSEEKDDDIKDDNEDYKGSEIRDTKTLNLSRNMSKFVAWQVVSVMKNEQQSQNLLLKVDPQQLSSTRSKCFCCATSNQARWKTRNINPKLETNNVVRQVEDFCISYFAALRKTRNLHDANDAVIVY